MGLVKSCTNSGVFYTEFSGHAVNTDILEIRKKVVEFSGHAVSINILEISTKLYISEVVSILW